MPPAWQHIHVYGNAAISTGSQSPARQGSDQQARVGHNGGVDFAVIMPLLEALIKELLGVQSFQTSGAPA